MPHWTETSLNDKERELLKACRDYARNNADAYLPGHTLMMLVDRLSTELDNLIHPDNQGGRRNLQQPPASRPTHTPTEAIDNPASAAQIKLIYSIATEKGWDDARLERESDKLYHCHPAHLSKREASSFIDHLKAS